MTNWFLVGLQIILIALTMFLSTVMLITLMRNRGRLFSDPEAKMYPEITMAVPAYNEEKNLERTVEYLMSQNYPGKMKVIIVNDGSTDKTGEIAESLKRKYKNISVIHRDKKSGRKAVPMNEALNKADSELFGFVDAETFLMPNSLTNMVGYFENPKVAAVIPTMKVHNPKSFLERMQRIEYTLTILARKTLTFLNSLFLTPGCAVYRKSVVEKLGGFDENNVTEDLEIGLRLNKAGYKIENSVEALCFTVVPNKFYPLTRQRIRWYRGLLYNIKKYGNVAFSRSDFGLFLFPFVLVGGTIGVFIYFFLLLNVVQEGISNFATFYRGLALSNFNLSLNIFNFSFEPNIFWFFGTIFLFLFMINIYFSRKIAGESIFSNLLDVATFLIIYSPILGAWWFYAMLKHIAGREMKW